MVFGSSDEIPGHDFRVFRLTEAFLPNGGIVFREDLIFRRAWGIIG